MFSMEVGREANVKHGEGQQHTDTWNVTGMVKFKGRRGGRLAGKMSPIKCKEKCPFTEMFSPSRKSSQVITAAAHPYTHHTHPNLPMPKFPFS